MARRRQVIVRVDAAADVDEAYRWYEARRTGYGEELLVQIGALLEQISELPEAFPIIHRQTRRALLPRFPYGIFYRLVDDIVVIVGCMHGRRHPRRWKRR